MVGYHYTTKEAWEVIQYEGMHPAPIRQHEFDKYVSVLPALPKDAIWVWQEELTNRNALIVLFTLCEMHQSFDMVLLRVEYDESVAASMVLNTHPTDWVRLKCNFAAGRLNTHGQFIELLIADIPASQVTKIWEIDLLEALRGRHAQEKDLIFA